MAAPPPPPAADAFLDGRLAPRSHAATGKGVVAHPSLAVRTVGFALPLTVTLTVINNETLLLTTASSVSGFSITTQDPWNPSFVVMTTSPAYTIKVTPLTPGGEYTLTFTAGASVISLPFTVPVGVEDPNGNIVAQRVPRTWGVLEALTWAIGKELQFLGGRPASRTTHPLDVVDTVLRVNSTLGYPESGFIFIEGLLLEYTAKADNAFLLVPEFRGAVIPDGTLVVSHTSTIPPRSAR